MDLKTMYPAANSRYTQLSRDITEDQDVIPVSDLSVFPPAPNYAAVETWDDQEVVLYRGIDEENGLLLDCERGVSDTTAKSWLAGADVLHVIAAQNINAVIDNVKLLAGESGGSEAVHQRLDQLEQDKADKSAVQTALDAKAYQKDLEALQSIVNEKAYQTDLNAVKTTAEAAQTTADDAMPKTGGTFSGQVIAQDSADSSKRVRNISYGTADPGTLAGGEIYFKVE